ncbi:unnamed protein product [Ambrosiozyma monospora]|uniref:Unnamed protein product n=1 Tax=Ambrosiozyma monospora TaxID=43982 RepID=A0ACB5SUU4_AMBMO|nr:unnamed protein product [Ambrosiozyma monospora]
MAGSGFNVISFQIDPNSQPKPTKANPSSNPYMTTIPPMKQEKRKRSQTPERPILFQEYDPHTGPKKKKNYTPEEMRKHKKQLKESRALRRLNNFAETEGSLYPSFPGIPNDPKYMLTLEEKVDINGPKALLNKFSEKKLFLGSGQRPIRPEELDVDQLLIWSCLEFYQRLYHAPKGPIYKLSFTQCAPFWLLFGHLFLSYHATYSTTNSYALACAHYLRNKKKSVTDTTESETEVTGNETGLGPDSGPNTREGYMRSNDSLIPGVDTYLAPFLGPIQQSSAAFPRNTTETTTTANGKKKRRPKETPANQSPSCATVYELHFDFDKEIVYFEKLRGGHSHPITEIFNKKISFALKNMIVEDHVVKCSRYVQSKDKIITEFENNFPVPMSITVSEPVFDPAPVRSTTSDLKPPLNPPKPNFQVLTLDLTPTIDKKSKKLDDIVCTGSKPITNSNAVEHQHSKARTDKGKSKTPETIPSESTPAQVPVAKPVPASGPNDIAVLGSNTISGDKQASNLTETHESKSDPTPKLKPLPKPKEPEVLSRLKQNLLAQYCDRNNLSIDDINNKLNKPLEPTKFMENEMAKTTPSATKPKPKPKSKPGPKPKPKENPKPKKYKRTVLKPLKRDTPSGSSTSTIIPAPKPEPRATTIDNLSLLCGLLGLSCLPNFQAGNLRSKYLVTKQQTWITVFEDVGRGLGGVVVNRDENGSWKKSFQASSRATVQCLHIHTIINPTHWLSPNY